MKLLLFSTLYPNASAPGHGLFVEQRLQQLRREWPELEAMVVAPVPWFPFEHARFGRYAEAARVPHEEVRAGVTVLHPRYAVLPKIGMSVAPLLMIASLRAWLARLRRERFAFDVIDAHFLYPDGIAAVWLGRDLGVPVTVTARGSDVTWYPRWMIPRRWLRWAFAHADHVIAVCQALAEAIGELNPRGTPVTVLRNGVDLERFTPREQRTARARLKFQNQTLLSVGNLVELKGHHLAIEALTELPQCELVIVGSGPERASLEALAQRRGVGTRVRFAGRVPQAELVDYYSAADVLVLASAREGWANVLLESMACGTPVVATAVWGTPEVVTAPAAGRLVHERTPAGLAAAIQALLADPPARAQTRAYAERFDWGATSRGQRAIFESLCGMVSRVGAHAVSTTRVT